MSGAAGGFWGEPAPASELRRALKGDGRGEALFLRNRQIGWAITEDRCGCKEKL